jgi:folate-binding Fe-S cluster repair protein YgfZ
MDETDDSASSSSLLSTEPAQGGSFGLPGVTSRPHSRQPSRPTTPSGLRMMPGPARPASPSRQHALSGHTTAAPSSHTTPSGSTLEAYRQVQEEEINILQNGQAAANSNIQLLMKFFTRLTNQLSHSHDSIMRHMAEQADALRLHMDVRMASFAHAVEVPVQHAVHASTTAADMASELAGRYPGMREDLERTFNPATAAHHAWEYARTEAH